MTEYTQKKRQTVVSKCESPPRKTRNMPAPRTVTNPAETLRKMRAVTERAAQMWDASDAQRRGFHLAWGHAKHSPVL
eukprot:799328-Rhodomonas_salina.1